MTSSEKRTLLDWLTDVDGKMSNYYDLMLLLKNTNVDIVPFFDAMEVLKNTIEYVNRK